MKNSLLALVGAAAFLHASDRANAIEIDVGGAKIEIPAPKGYVAVTSEYSVLERFMKSLVAPANLYLASFVDGESLKASDSGIPDLTRYFSVQVLRQIQSRTVSKGDFDELKELVRNQNKEILKQTEKELDKALGGVTENLKNEFDMDAALKIADFVPFDPHHEDERSYAFSILMKGSANVEGTSEKVVVNATATFVHARGRVLYAYCYGGPDDIEWTRDESKRWMESIFSANTASASLGETISKSPFGRILLYAIVGGVIGGVVMFFKKRAA